MASAKNKVIAGDYAGWDVIVGGKKLSFMHRLTRFDVNKNNVSNFELVTSQSGNSFWGSFLRGYVSNALLGPAGLMASTIGQAGRQAVLISFEFTGGQRSLVEVDGKLYKKILQILY